MTPLKEARTRFECLGFSKAQALKAAKSFLRTKAKVDAVEEELTVYHAHQRNRPE